MLIDLTLNFIPPTPQFVKEKILRRIKDAYAYVPFYKALLDREKLTPEDFRTLADYVEYFPRTTSAEYRELLESQGDSFLLDKRFLNRRLRKLLSGGSSGTPVNIMRTEHEYRKIHGANTIYTLLLGGVRPWHKIMAFLPPWDIRTKQYYLQHFGIFRRYDACFLESMDTIIDRIVNKKVNVLFGRVSMMRMLAERILETGRVLEPMVAILPGSEIVTPETRRQLKDVFRPRSYAEIYGATETGVIALKKATGDYQVNFRSAFIALTHPKVYADVTVGEIAATSLDAVAAPILMLELGDVVSCKAYDELYDLKTSIHEIRGREKEYIVCNNGEKVSAAEFYSWLVSEPIVKQFRIVQDKVGECDVILRTKDCTAIERSALERRLQSKIPASVVSTFRYVKTIPVDENGKTKIIINRLNTAEALTPQVLPP